MTSTKTVLLVALGSVVCASAALRVSPETHVRAIRPRVAPCDDYYFVAWVRDGYEEQVPEIWGVCVDRNLQIVSDYFTLYEGGANTITALEISSKADTVLAVFEEVDEGGDITVWGRLVYTNTGQVVILPDRITPDEALDFTRPAVASNADSFLVAFRDEEGSIRTRGVYGLGTLGEPAVEVTDGDFPTLASDGQEFLLVYVASSQVCGKQVPDGQSFVLLAQGADGQPGVTYQASEGTFQAAFRESGFWGTALLSRQSSLTAALGEIVVVCDAVAVDSFDVAPADINCMVVWQKEADYDRATAQRIDEANALVGPQEIFRQNEEPLVHDPHAASDGTYYGVVWHEPDETPLQSAVVYFDTVCSYQRHFRVPSEWATAYNQGRHIALDPETGTLHRVYHPQCGGSPDSALYTWSVDSGENWFPYEFVGLGNYPCVAYDATHDRVWVSYRASVDRVACKARLGTSNWQGHEFDCPDPDVAFCNPSMSVSYEQSLDPCVYVANRIIEGPAEWKIVCHVVRLSAGVNPEVVYESPTPLLGIPSLETTPFEGSDIVHCVWPTCPPVCQEDQLLYRMRVNGRWLPEPPLPPERVSRESQEPVWSSSISQYGDSVYAVWEGEDPLGSCVWQRPRHVDPAGSWGTDRLLSPEPGPYSRFPQGSLGRITTVWSEYITPMVHQILLDIDNERIESLRGPIPGLDFCHIASALYEQPGNADVKVYATWTEQTREEFPPDEVLFARFTFSLEPEFGSGDVPFYNCRVGDSVRSLYCQRRDGWSRWGEYNVDYGHENLRYRLKYLKPECIYKVRVILYHASRDVWEQSLAMDGVPVCRFRYRPQQPETVWVSIPRDLYRRDYGVDLDITRLAGDYAVLADLAVYEVYPFMLRQGGGGCDVLVGDDHLAAPLRVRGANPFCRQARVEYTVPFAQRVSVRVFDARGRVVKELHSGRQGPGRYTLAWNGTDFGGRSVAAGTYFVEIRTDGCSCHARKVVYAP